MDFPTDADIIKLIQNDSIKNAEDLTGKSIDEDEATMNLGLMMSLYDNMVKDHALNVIGDTTFGMDWFAYCEKIETFGFGLMLEDFDPNSGEALRIYYHEKDGLLLNVDSYHGDRNASTVYYNWKPSIKPKNKWKNPNVAELIDFWDITSTGHFYYPGHKGKDIPEDVSDQAWDSIVWTGNHDAREALAFNMNQLRENGTFVPQWKEQPYLWLIGHWERGDAVDYNEITANRIKRLPEWVQYKIKGE